MLEQQPQAKAKVYGPYNIASRIGPEGVTFLALPFVDVRNSQIIISTRDNAINALIGDDQTDSSYLMLTAEISAWGSVQGYETLIKRQNVKSTWGPMSFRLTDDDAYNQIFLKARLFVGGKPGLPSDLVLNVPLVIDATIHVQPRGGFG